nr:hypothetical protein BaRGS_023322 [Batillaria attramentaria]
MASKKDQVKNVTGSHNYVGNKAKGQAQMNFGNTQDSHDANISGSYNAEKNRRKHAQPEDTGGEALPEWGQQPEESDTLEVQVDLPEKWPDAEIHDPHSVSVAFVEDGTEMETLFNSTVEHKLSSVYPMHQKIRGVFLLINNETFNEPEASSRHGTELDAEALEQLFDQLGFSVESHTDCTAKEMQDLLESQFKKRDHKQYDSFACAILSHGSRGVVKGVDGNELSLDTITDIVTRSNCRSLVGKPKLFFIQACQGDYTDRGIEREDGDVDEEPGQEDIIYLDSENRYINGEIAREETITGVNGGKPYVLKVYEAHGILEEQELRLTGQCPRPDSDLIQAIKDFDAAVNASFAPSTDTMLATFPFLRFLPAYLTSLQTMKALFLYLLHNPDVTRKVQQEIDDVIGNQRPPRVDDRRKLPYTEAVVMETLRYSSITPLGLPHLARSDVIIDGVTVSQGAMV